MFNEMDSLIAKIQLPETQAINEEILKDEDDEFKNLSMNLKTENQPIEDFDEKKDLKLVKILEETISSTDKTAFHTALSIINKNNDREQTSCQACSQRVEDDRFDDFDEKKISSTFHGAFAAARQFKKPTRIHKQNLPTPPKTIQDLKNHPFKAEFRKTQTDHLESHCQLQSFFETDQRHVRGQQVLHCMWVFIYKTDKHDFLQKCKTCLVVCENQQTIENLPTRATTLTSMMFRALMTITAKFDLKTVQMNVVNVFVNSKLDEVVYMRQPSGFEKGNTVLQLDKALYDLRRSPLL